MSKVACEAVLCYTSTINNIVPERYCKYPQAWIHLDWRRIMDTLPPHAQEGNLEKHCTGPCGRILPATIEYFYPYPKGRAPGLRPMCRVCTQEQRREYLSRPEVKQHRREQGKEYQSRPEVQERTQRQRKEYNSRPEVQEHRQAYYARPEIIQREKNQKKIYHERPEVKERVNKYRARPEIIQHMEEWRKEYRARPEFKEEDRLRSHNRRSRKKSVDGTYTTEQIVDQLKRQKHKCYYCRSRFKKSKGRYIYHIEHTYPLSRVAGTDIPANSIDYLVLACPTCNLSKGDKFPWEWTEGGRLL